MTTIVQFVPKWLRVRLQKPAQPKSKTLNKKDRQILPTLPNTNGPSILLSADEKQAVHRLRGLT
jgi:hypothetical protein